VICTVAAFGGFHLHALRVGGEAAFHLGWFGIPLTVMWLLLTTNLVNLIDGIDGLAGGVSLFVFVTLTLTALLSIGAPILLVCVVMIGALLGFLVFNFPPARIFMGDGGAYFIGFLIGQVGLAAEHKSTIVAALLVPMLALGLPIIDTTLAVLRRGIRGLPLFMADREHVHHMLLDLGLSPRRVVLALYFVCAMMSLGAVVVLLNQGRGVALALGALFSLMLTAALGLGYIRRDNPWLQISDAFRMRGRTAYVVELCRLLRFEAARTDSVAHFWREFGVALHKAGIATARFEPAVEGLPEMQLGSGESPHDWVQTWPVLAGMDRVGTLTMSVSRSGMDERLFRRQALLFREAFQAGLDRVLRARRQVMQSRGSGVAAGPGGGRA
jgi:UDP-GlcNAc:undecaprenyl-phosphate GlcNAc-1-phosphate transferase